MIVMSCIHITQTYPEEILSLLIHSNTEITADFMQDFLQPQFSPTGSNARAKEEKIFYNWATYLQDSGGMQQLAMLFFSW